jgi:hypothetical protein
MLVKPRGNDQVQCISDENTEISIEIMDRKYGIVIYYGGIRVVFQPDNKVTVEKECV